MEKAGSLAILFLIVFQTTSSQLAVTRRHPVDTFSSTVGCRQESCLSQSMGTAVGLGEDGCSCACLPHLPAFREDLHICVDDLHDCPLIPFMSGTTYQKIPYVFLPLKGQIVYPSAELVFAGAESPICVVSASRFLSSAGWEDLRNRSDAEPPFRLFPDEGRTFLQWLGDGSLRENLEGRLILVHLMCKDMVDDQSPTNNIFTSCISFRVAGTPSENMIQPGVKEVSFSVDTQLQSQNMSSSYIAIAVSSVVLGLIYITSVLFYLQMKKRKTKFSDSRSGPLGVVEEGIVKNNPLLKHCHENPGYLADQPPSCSESDDGSELPSQVDDHQHGIQTTAMIHPCITERDKKFDLTFLSQEASNIERLPEENVSIIETLDVKEERSETARAMTTINGRRKLYFNPAYFEPELLLAPPPAAIEFLTKIREVISIAKAKMEAKRFLPSLMGIPEENDYSFMKGSSMAGSESTVVFRRDGNNGHRSSCYTKHFRHSEQTCHGCCRNTDQKQNSIQKWLEDVPLAMADDEVSTTGSNNNENAYSHHETCSIKSTSSKHGNKSDISDSVYANKEVIDNCENVSRKSSDIKSDKNIKNVINSDFFKENDLNVKTDAKYNNELKEKGSTNVIGSRLNEYTNFKPTLKENISDLKPTSSDKAKNSSNDTNSTYEPIQDSIWIDECTDDETTVMMNNNRLSTSPDQKENKPSLMNKINSEMNKKSVLLDMNSNEKRTEDNDYETIIHYQQATDKLNGGVINQSSRYSLVSEVYVNDGYDCVSESSHSNLSSINSNISEDEVEYDRSSQGHLTIKVRDNPPIDYTNESDSFEPDTLDRKPNKLKINQEISINIEKTQDIFADSLERPPQISLKSSGTFKSDAGWHIQETNVSCPRHPLNRAFGSLREIFEAKTKYNQCAHTKPIKSSSPDSSTTSLINEKETFRTSSWKRGKPKLLVSEGRKQTKRQRSPSPPNQSILKPPLMSNLNHCKQTVYKKDERPPLLPRVIKPPLPPKNEAVRISNGLDHADSCNFQNISQPALETQKDTGLICGLSPSQYKLFFPLDHSSNNSLKDSPNLKSDNQPKNVQEKTPNSFTRQLTQAQNRTEDSGYLSTDSNGSDVLKQEDSVSETDDSFFDGGSESGAESIATDSFFFGKFRKSGKASSSEGGSPIYSRHNLSNNCCHSPIPP